MMERNIPRELFGERTRTAIRDLMGGTLLREINEMWQDEGFPPAQDPKPVGGQRVTRFQGYLNQVDWTDPGEVHRALRVFEVALRSLSSQPEALAPTVEVVISRVRRLLEKDGYTLDGEGRITGGPLTVINDQLLSSVSDPAAIHDHLERISRALGGDDPAQVIGSAKELIESTAKIVLTARQKMYKPGDDLPKLVDEAQKALSLHPS